MPGALEVLRPAAGGCAPLPHFAHPRNVGGPSTYFAMRRVPGSHRQERQGRYGRLKGACADILVHFSYENNEN